MKKVVLGFSGGLDTSYCVKYLTEEKGYEVHSVIVNTGGFSEEELQESGFNVTYGSPNRFFCILISYFSKKPDWVHFDWPYSFY